MRWTVWPIVLLAAFATAGVSVAQTGLELIDGRVLEGVAVERVKDGFELQLASGARIVIPAELVLEVRQAVEPSPAPIPEVDLPEPPSLPSITRRPYEQLAVFGLQRATVAQGVVDSAWWPTSDLQQELVENEFDPSSFVRPAIGARWVPEESLDRADDWSRSPSARWARAPIGSAWWPSQGSPGIDAGPEFD
jgi:hypothetical protein